MRRLVILAVLVAIVCCTSSAQTEVRTWRAAAGGFTAQAEFVGMKDKATVTLRLGASDLIDVPLEKLCDEDQAYIRAKLTPPKSTASKAPSKGAAAALEKEAQQCRSALEALALYQAFLDDSAVSVEDKSAAQTRIGFWEEMALKSLVRLGTKWVAEEEATSARNEAMTLLHQGIELVKLSQDDLAREKLLEASRTDPNAIGADFVMGMIYALVARNFAKANTHFEVCLKRDPDNPAVLNNLALTEVKLGQWGDAVMHWHAAAAIAKDQRLVQNMGRFVDQAGKGFLLPPPPKSAVDDLSRLYATMILSKDITAINKKRGWQYMVIPLIKADPTKDKTGEEPKEEPKPVTGPKKSPTTEPRGPVVSGGTGFVIHPHYILTNRHVVEDAATLEIMEPSTEIDRRHPVTVHAVSKNYDLALVHCPTFNAPPLPLEVEVPRRGTDVMLLGFPDFFAFGTTVKATRGSIVSLPNDRLEGMLFYDATSNPGNSGGPLCTKRAAVTAVHCIGYMTATPYGGGIPIGKALPMIKESIPDFQEVPKSDRQLEWPDVDECVSRSTVLILCRAPVTSTGLNKRVTKEKKEKDYWEDRACNLCNGSGMSDCPVRNCNRGTVPATRSAVVGQNPATGGNIVEDISTRIKCNGCNGKGTVSCKSCRGSGRDPDL